MGKAMYSLLATFAELERAGLSQRVKAGMDRLRAEGKPMGGWPRGVKRNGLRGGKLVTEAATA